MRRRTTYLPFLILMTCFWLPACSGVRRVGQVARLRPAAAERLEEMNESFERDVAPILNRYGIRNYSIYLKELSEGEPYLFKYMEYTGRDFEGDLAKLREDPKFRQWERTLGEECLVKTPDNDKDWWMEGEEIFYYSGRDDKKVDPSEIKRHGQAIGLRSKMVESYVLIHANTWPGVLNALYESNLRNFPIYMVKIGKKYYLFGYFEYVGTDFTKDMAAIGADPTTKAWIKFTDDGCQLPLPTRAAGEWWAQMVEVLHGGSPP